MTHGERHPQLTGIQRGPGDDHAAARDRPPDDGEEQREPTTADGHGAGEPVVTADREPGEGGEGRHEHHGPRVHGASPLGSSRSMRDRWR